MVHFDAFGAFSADALVHFGSGIQVQHNGSPLLVVSDAGTQLKKAGKLISEGDPSSLDWNCIREGAAKNGTD